MAGSDPLDDYFAQATGGRANVSREPAPSDEGWLSRAARFYDETPWLGKKWLPDVEPYIKRGEEAVEPYVGKWGAKVLSAPARINQFGADMFFGSPVDTLGTAATVASFGTAAPAVAGFKALTSAPRIAKGIATGSKIAKNVARGTDAVQALRAGLESGREFSAGNYGSAAMQAGVAGLSGWGATDYNPFGPKARVDAPKPKETAIQELHRIAAEQRAARGNIAPPTWEDIGTKLDRLATGGAADRKVVRESYTQKGTPTTITDESRLLGEGTTPLINRPRGATGTALVANRPVNRAGEVTAGIDMTQENLAEQAVRNFDALGIAETNDRVLRYIQEPKYREKIELAVAQGKTGTTPRIIEHNVLDDYMRPIGKREFTPEQKAAEFKNLRALEEEFFSTDTDDIVDNLMDPSDMELNGKKYVASKLTPEKIDELQDLGLLTRTEAAEMRMHKAGLDPEGMDMTIDQPMKATIPWDSAAGGYTGTVGEVRPGTSPTMKPSRTLFKRSHNVIDEMAADSPNDTGYFPRTTHMAVEDRYVDEFGQNLTRRELPEGEKIFDIKRGLSDEQIKEVTDFVEARGVQLTPGQRVVLERETGPRLSGVLTEIMTTKGNVSLTDAIPQELTAKIEALNDKWRAAVYDNRGTFTAADEAQLDALNKERTRLAAKAFEDNKLPEGFRDFMKEKGYFATNYKGISGEETIAGALPQEGFAIVDPSNLPRTKTVERGGVPPRVGGRMVDEQGNPIRAAREVSRATPEATTPLAVKSKILQIFKETNLQGKTKDEYYANLGRQLSDAEMELAVQNRFLSQDVVDKARAGSQIPPRVGDTTGKVMPWETAEANRPVVKGLGGQLADEATDTTQGQNVIAKAFDTDAPNVRPLNEDEMTTNNILREFGDQQDRALQSPDNAVRAKAEAFENEYEAGQAYDQQLGEALEKARHDPQKLWQLAVDSFDKRPGGGGMSLGPQMGAEFRLAKAADNGWITRQEMAAAKQHYDQAAHDAWEKAGAPSTPEKFAAAFRQATPTQAVPNTPPPLASRPVLPQTGRWERGPTQTLVAPPNTTRPVVRTMDDVRQAMIANGMANPSDEFVRKVFNDPKLLDKVVPPRSVSEGVSAEGRHVFAGETVEEGVKPLAGLLNSANPNDIQFRKALEDKSNEFLKLIHHTDEIGTKLNKAKEIIGDSEFGAIIDRVKTTQDGWAKKFVKGMGMSMETELERMGPGGKAVAHLFKLAATDAPIRFNNYMKGIDVDLRKMKHVDFEKVVDALEGKKVELTPELENFKTRLEGVLKVSGTEMEEHGLLEKGLRQNYFPHRYDGVPTETLRQKMRADGMTEDQVSKALKDIQEHRELKTSGEYSRNDLNIPGYRKDKNVLIDHLRETAKRVEHAKRFGAKDIADPESQLSRFVRASENPQRAKDLSDRILRGGRQVSPESMMASKAIRNYATAAHLSLASISQLGGAVPIAMRTSMKETLMGLGKALREDPNSKFMKNVNYARDFATHWNDGAKGDMLYKAFGIQGVQNYMNKVAGQAGYAHAQTLFGALQKDPTNKLARKQLEDLTLTPIAEVLKQPQLTEHQLQRAMTRMAEISQGTAEAKNLPYHWVGNGTRLIPQIFQRMAFQGTKAIKDGLMEGDMTNRLKKLGVLGITGMVAGEVIGDVKEIPKTAAEVGTNTISQAMGWTTDNKDLFTTDWANNEYLQNIGVQPDEDNDRFGYTRKMVGQVSPEAGKDENIVRGISNLMNSYATGMPGDMLLQVSEAMNDRRPLNAMMSGFWAWDELNAVAENTQKLAKGNWRDPTRQVARRFPVVGSGIVREIDTDFQAKGGGGTKPIIKSGAW